ARLARIVIYPVKSLDGVAVAEALVLPSGALEHDRRWALVDVQGKSINGKRTPRIHLLRSTIDPVAQKIVLTAGRKPGAFNIDAEGAPLEEGLSDFFGLAVQIEENAAAGFPDDTAAPGPTVISTATLADVAGWFPGLDLGESRRRFRA